MVVLLNNINIFFITISSSSPIPSVEVSLSFSTSAETFCSNGAWGKLDQPAHMGCGSGVIPLRGLEGLVAQRRGAISRWSSRTREAQREEEQAAKLSGALFIFQAKFREIILKSESILS